MTDLPIISILNWKDGDESAQAQIAHDVDSAFREFGFLLVGDHGVSDSLAASIRKNARTFFAYNDDIKDPYRSRVGGRGWIPPGAEANSYASGVAAPSDLKESFKVGMGFLEDSDTGQANVWPSEVPELAVHVEAYLHQVWLLATALFSLFEQSLLLRPGTLTRHASPIASSLNLNFYPSLRTTGTPQPGQFRIGAHSDFGVLTILDRQAGYGGLQIQTLKGDWINAPDAPGALTINVGDMLSRWTGDRWRSTVHRVLPPSTLDVDEELLSLVNFCGVRPSTTIETLSVGGPTNYESVLAGDYMKSKLQSIDVLGKV